MAAKPQRRPIGVGAGVLLSLASLVWVLEVRADEASDLEKAYGAFVAHKYPEAEARLRALIDPTSGSIKDPDTLADARMYLGAALLAENRPADAARVFEQLLVDKPEYQPDPLRVPLSALDALVDAKARLRDRLIAIQAKKTREAQVAAAEVNARRELEAKRMVLLEKMATEVVVVRRHTRWEALVPFGVGQFQNEEPTLGFFLLATESLFAISSAVGLGGTLYNQGLANDAYKQGIDTARGYEGRAQDWSTFGNASALAFAAVAIGGAIEAELSFQPEHMDPVRRRPLPTVSLAPMLGPLSLGLSGKF